jgi:hypothetical protein
MWKWFQNVDVILRGEATSPVALRDGELKIPLRDTVAVALALAAIYGLCMGSFSVFKEIDPKLVSHPTITRTLQLMATTIKVPLLFALTLAVTFPSLYVFNALVGSRLHCLSMLRLLVASLAVNICVLASLGPIVAFFSVSTNSYGFMVLFNVAMFTIGGVLGLMFLLRTLNRMTRGTLPSTNTAEGSVGEPQNDARIGSVDDDQSESDTEQVEAALVDHGALDLMEGEQWGRRVRFVFTVWLVTFSLVGSQMGWVLRPFIGDPKEPFTLFRERESNFFAAVLRTLGHLLGIVD